MKNSFLKIFAKSLVMISIFGYTIFQSYANARLNPTVNSSSASPVVSGPGQNSQTLPTTRKDGAREKVVLAGDSWCPFNCEPNSGKEGVLVEIARKAFEKNNIDVVYVVKPWAEAMSDLVLGKIDGILGASATEIQDSILPSIEQANTKIATFTLKESPWIYDGIVTLKNKPLGIVEGYTYPDDIKTYINSNYLTSPENFVYAMSDDPIKENIDNLLNKKTELYIEDENVFTYYTDSKM